MIVHCLYDEMAETSSLSEHPKNANQHSEEQIERLAKIIEYQGFRHPIKVSRQSGFITSGHGRLYAAKHLQYDRVPVVYQDYKDEDQELADLHADNAIASWSIIDRSMIHEQLQEFDPNFDLEMLGFERFEVEPADLLKEPDDQDEKPPQRVRCPNCKEVFGVQGNKVNAS